MERILIFRRPSLHINNMSDNPNESRGRSPPKFLDRVRKGVRRQHDLPQLPQSKPLDATRADSQDHSINPQGSVPDSDLEYSSDDDVEEHTFHNGTDPKGNISIGAFPPQRSDSAANGSAPTGNQTTSSSPTLIQATERAVHLAGVCRYLVRTMYDVCAVLLVLPLPFSSPIHRIPFLCSPSVPPRPGLSSSTAPPRPGSWTSTPPPQAATHSKPSSPLCSTRFRSQHTSAISALRTTSAGTMPGTPTMRGGSRVSRRG
ncbi:hypothetical protein B0H12DRAFT_695978 [Mycena haematopus]|nr:hypothetical protein B0H12DRAFT_695978 [Mycena haematopus]